jgi:aminopeptidase N
MLRQRIGDDRFWAGIRAYHQRFKDASASTTEFREVMEQASGQDLAPFFTQGLYRGGVPRLAGTWSWDPAAKAVTIELRQTQAGAPFRLAVDVGIRPPGGAQRLERVEITGAEARATFRADVEPAAVVIDPDVRLLAAIEISRTPARGRGQR